MKFNTYFLESYRDIIFPAIIIDYQDLYSAHNMAHLKNVLLRCRMPEDRFIKILDATGYEFLFEPPLLTLAPNVLRQPWPWKKKEILELYESSRNKPADTGNLQTVSKKPLKDVIAHIADLIQENKPSLAGRLARPFRIRRRFDLSQWMN